MRGRAGRFGKLAGRRFVRREGSCGRLSFLPRSLRAGCGSCFWPQSPRRALCQRTSACFNIPFCRRGRPFLCLSAQKRQKAQKIQKAQKTPRGQKPQGVENAVPPALHAGGRASFVRASTQLRRTFLALAPGRPSASGRKACIHRLFSAPAGKSVLLPFIANMIVTQKMRVCQDFGASFCTICMICSAPRPYFSAMSRA